MRFRDLFHTCFEALAQKRLLVVDLKLRSQNSTFQEAADGTHIGNGHRHVRSLNIGQILQMKFDFKQPSFSVPPPLGPTGFLGSYDSPTCCR